MSRLDPGVTPGYLRYLLWFLKIEFLGKTYFWDDHVSVVRFCVIKIGISPCVGLLKRFRASDELCCLVDESGPNPCWATPCWFSGKIPSPVWLIQNLEKAKALVGQIYYVDSSRKARKFYIISYYNKFFRKILIKINTFRANDLVSWLTTSLSS